MCPWPMKMEVPGESCDHCDGGMLMFYVDMTTTIKVCMICRYPIGTPGLTFVHVVFPPTLEEAVAALETIQKLCNFLPLSDLAEVLNLQTELQEEEAAAMVAANPGMPPPFVSSSWQKLNTIITIARDFNPNMYF